MIRLRCLLMPPLAPLTEGSPSSTSSNGSSANAEDADTSAKYLCACSRSFHKVCAPPRIRSCRPNRNVQAEHRPGCSADDPWQRRAASSTRPLRSRTPSRTLADRPRDNKRVRAPHAPCCSADSLRCDARPTRRLAGVAATGRPRHKQTLEPHIALTLMYRP